MHLVQQLRRQPETANATAQCDSRITGSSRNSVGVDKGLYARQQAKLKAYRKERDQKKIYKYKPAAAEAEADAVKVGKLTATAAAAGNKMGLAFESFAQAAEKAKEGFLDGSRIKEVMTRHGTAVYGTTVYGTTGWVHGNTVLHRMRNPEYKTNPEQEQGKEQDHNI